MEQLFSFRQNGIRATTSTEIGPGNLVGGGYASIINESGDVATLVDRIRTSSGGDILIGSNKIQVWFQWDGTVWRWRVPDWSVSAGSVAYTPGDGADWVDPDPTTVGEAIDRIAARVSSLALGLGVPIG